MMAKVMTEATPTYATAIHQTAISTSTGDGEA